MIENLIDFKFCFKFKKGEQLFLDEDLLLFDCYSNKKRNLSLNELELGLGSGYPDVTTEEPETTTVLPTTILPLGNIWSLRNVVVLQSSSNRLKKRSDNDPTIIFKQVEEMVIFFNNIEFQNVSHLKVQVSFIRFYFSYFIEKAISILKNIAEKITGIWTRSAPPSPAQYSLDLVLSWSSSIKNTTDLQNYANIFLTNKIDVLAQVPNGYSANISKDIIQIELGSIGSQCSTNNVPVTTTTTTTTTTTKLSPVSTMTSPDTSGLILVIVLPILGVLLLAFVAGSICFCWLRK